MVIILYHFDVIVNSVFTRFKKFGFGNAFDSLVSGAAYVFFLKKERIDIFG